MEKVKFPKWVFHKSGNAQIVNDEKELETLGKDWKESPADFVEKPKESSAMNLDEMSVEELVKLAIEKGIAKKEAKALDKDQLLALLKG